ncbi:MAG: hypothetical protein HUJ96_06155 [Marinilabiliaceae bacterium]|nr:hypothetical protein [Marinilabiliaceae bacterium]
MNEVKKFVTVSKEKREWLVKAFQVSGVMVWKALTFESNSPLAQRIRKAAMNHGGILMVCAPEFSTMHDSDGYMRQYFPNGVMVEFHKKNNTAAVMHKGRVIKIYDHVLVSDISAIQEYAKSLR